MEASHLDLVFQVQSYESMSIIFELSLGGEMTVNHLSGIQNLKDTGKGNKSRQNTIKRFTTHKDNISSV